MNINEYQEKAQSFDLTKGTKYHARHAIFGLLEEVGEVAGIFKRFYRGDYDIGETIDSHIIKDKMYSEIGDVFWYVAALAAAHGFTLEEVAQHNIAKLEARKAKGVIKGGGER